METVGLVGGKLLLIVQILLVKNSEKASGRLTESKEDETC